MKRKNKHGFRRILAGLCMLCMACVTWFGIMPAYAAGDAQLSASECTAEKGKTVAVTLNLEGNPGIWGLKFRVSYDHSALKLTSVTNGTVFSGDETVPPESLDKEKYVFVATADKLENVQADGELVTLKFEVAEGAAFADYPISVEVTQAITADGKAVSIAAKNGNVKVQEDSNLVQLLGPKTGDKNQLILWAALAGISGGAVLVFRTSRKKRRIKA